MNLRTSKLFVFYYIKSAPENLCLSNNQREINNYQSYIEAPLSLCRGPIGKQAQLVLCPGTKTLNV